MLSATFRLNPSPTVTADFTRVGDNYEIVTTVSGRTVSTIRKPAAWVATMVAKAEAERRV